MSNLVQETFQINLKILQILVGFTNTKYKYKLPHKIYAVFIYFFMICPTPILMATYLFVTENVTMEIVSDGAFLIFQCGSVIFKIMPFIFNTNEVFDILYSLEDPVFDTNSKQQTIFINKYIKTCKLITIMFLGFCGVSLVLWGARPIFLGSSCTFPTQFYTPYEPCQSHFVYILSYIYVFFGVSEGAISNGVLDPLVAGLLVFATCQVDILKDNLQNLDKDVTNIKNLEKNDIIYKRIEKCVIHHNAILKFVDRFEKTFSQVVFSQFVASVSVICVTILQMSMVSPLSFIFFQMAVFFVTMLIECFLYCYYGTCLYDKSNSITNAIYVGHWYEYDIKSQKALLTIMEKAKKPIRVTAGKILDLSLETFTTILRRAYSLLAVLKNY